MKRISNHHPMMKTAYLVMATIMLSFTHVNLNEPIKLVFVDHLTAGLIEQDIFVEKIAGSGEVYRVLPSEMEEYLDAPIYKSAEIQKHNPFDPSTAGPFKMGESMNMTLGEWRQAKGQADYTCEGGWGVLTATFENLMPNAKYTIWHFFMAKASTEYFPGTLDLPLGDPDGSQSVFTTDENGNASIEVKFERCLQLSNIQLAGALAVAYHSDGQTYGTDPGPFGRGTHVQLFAMLPDADKPIKVGMKE